MITTWRIEITDTMKGCGDDWQNVEACTLSEEELDVEFDEGYGSTEGKPFTVWTHDRVYFPVCYDGAEWCDSVTRNPDGKPTTHVGGG